MMNSSNIKKHIDDSKCAANEISVSVIVPVYNSSKYLDTCITSIINQSYEKTEIILVDDGSTDDSQSVIKRYCDTYGNVRGFSQENKGQNAARLTGVTEAKGQYIMFVDADDWIETNLVEKMIADQIRTGADMLISGIIYDYPSYSYEDCGSVLEGGYAGENKKTFYENFIFSTPNTEGIKRGLVAKLIERQLIKDVLTELPSEIHVGEDQVGTFACCLKANSIYVKHLSGYHYVKRDDSITGSIQMNFLTQMNQAYLYMLECAYHHKYYETVKESLDKWLINMLINGSTKYMRLKTKTPKYNINYQHDISKGERVVLYGAGEVGQQIHDSIIRDNSVDLVLWVDNNYEKYCDQGYDVRAIEEIHGVDYEKIIIAIKNKTIADQIKDNLIHDMGVKEENISFPFVRDNFEI